MYMYILIWLRWKIIRSPWLFGSVGWDGRDSHLLAGKSVTHIISAANFGFYTL